MNSKKDEIMEILDILRECAIDISMSYDISPEDTPVAESSHLPRRWLRPKDGVRRKKGSDTFNPLIGMGG